MSSASVSIVEVSLHFLELVVLTLGAFFATRQLRLQREEIHANALLERRRRSMEIDGRLLDLAAERRRVESSFPPSEWSVPIASDRLVAAFHADEHLEPALRQLISEMDLLALPVCAHAADEDMAFELVGSTVVAYATAFKLYIVELRLRLNRPDLYIYLTSLVETRWAGRDKRERDLLAGGAAPLFLR